MNFQPEVSEIKVNYHRKVTSMSIARSASISLMQCVIRLLLQ